MRFSIESILEVISVDLELILPLQTIFVLV